MNYAATHEEAVLGRRSVPPLVLLTAGLLGLGIVMIFSASGVLADKFDSPYFFLRRQAMWVCVGTVAMLFTAHFDYHRYRTLSLLILIAVFAGLVLVLVPGMGMRFNGARRWIRFCGVGFQPSEVAKLGSVIYMAHFLSKRQERIKEFCHGFLPPMMILAAILGLVVIEPDLGTTALIGTVVMSMLFVAGIRLIHIVPITFVSCSTGLVLLLTRYQYMLDRLMTFIYPERDPSGTGYHIKQSLIAIGSGGIFGVGLGSSTQKRHFLSEAHTDFIFSIIGEELGFVGTMVVISLFVTMIYHGIKICNSAPDLYGSLLAFGIVMLVGMQAAVHIAVVTASVPTKGISLPLVSFGGSNLVLTMVGLGILINIARHGPHEAPREGTLDLSDEEE